MAELIVWVTPYTGLQSLGEMEAEAKRLGKATGARPKVRLLLPMHYGPWVESDCRHTLPADAVVSSLEDATRIRQTVESHGLRFGAWGVPHRTDGGLLAGQLAKASGYYVANFECGEFWTHGQSDPQPVTLFWGAYWDAAGDALDKHTFATLVPSSGELGAYANGNWAVLREIAAGCSGLVLETYGGSQTASSYPWPNIWPMASLERVRLSNPDFKYLLMPADENLAEQWKFSAWAGSGVVHTWSI